MRVKIVRKTPVKMVQYSKTQTGHEKWERVILEKVCDCVPPASPGASSPGTPCVRNVVPVLGQ